MPHWKDQCNHGDDNFVGSFSVRGAAHDLYVDDVMDCCIRYGNEPHEYISPGSVSGLFVAEDPIYKAAALLLCKQPYAVFMITKTIEDFISDVWKNPGIGEGNEYKLRDLMSMIVKVHNTLKHF